MQGKPSWYSSCQQAFGHDNKRTDNKSKYRQKQITPK
jgi:hypothetical protein